MNYGSRKTKLYEKCKQKQIARLSFIDSSLLISRYCNLSLTEEWLNIVERGEKPQNEVFYLFRSFQQKTENNVRLATVLTDFT